ncbi:hypothetical protein Tco_1168373, partial [Tanacetum coccineum]
SVDKIVRDPNPISYDETPNLSQRLPNCHNCGDPVDGLYCRPCTFVRKCLNEGWFTIHDENEILNTSESSNDDTNIVSAPQEPFVVKQDPGKNSSQSPPHIDHNYCYEYGDSLDDIFCQRCTCKSCGKGAHYGYNCPPQIPIISNPEPCYNQNLNEILQNLQSLQQQCLFGTCQQCGCNEYDGVCFYCTVGNRTPINFSTPYSSNDSLSFSNPPPQPPTYSYEFCGNDAYYGHDCPPQVPFICNPEPCYNQDFNFPQNFQSFQQQYPCCENCGGPHETFQCQPMNENYYHEQNSCYDPNSFGFDQIQPPQYTVNHPVFNAQNELIEQMTSLCDMVGQYMQKKEEDKQIAEDQAAKDRYWKIPICYDDDDDKESSFPLNDVIISGLPPYHSEIVIDSNNDYSLSDDDSPYGEDIDYVNASPLDSELVSLEVVEIVISEVGGIDTDILLTIKDDILCEKLLNVNLLIAKIEALKDNPTPSSDFVTKSPSTSPNFFLEETDTFDNSLPESETFCFNLEEISSGSTTTRSDYSLPDYEAFYFDDDHIEEKSSGSTTTHADFSQYDSFIFDLSIDPSPPADRSDFYHEEFADELAHIISPPEYDSFYFKIEPKLGDFTMDVVEDIFDNPTRSQEFMCLINKIFDPRIFSGIQSKIFLLPDEFSISFIRDLPFPVIDTLLSFSSKNEDKVINTGILAADEEKSPHIIGA